MQEKTNVRQKHDPYSLLQAVSILDTTIAKGFYIVTIQPPPNQLANIDFDVIGTFDY